ncbi:MAG: nucleoside-diphosphate kinase [candidate division NC10 bacterium]|nr:nucleoside-diphosphate kinase [candidate division NC10 bacterium]
MPIERTLVIVKPDAVRRGLIGDVIGRFEQGRLAVRGLRMVHLTKGEAERFYAVHRERPFFDSLTTFMASGPVVVVVLEGAEAIGRVRKIMGATDPAQAEPGTIRRDLAESIERNTVHGSDSPEAAAFEIPYFFAAVDLFPG